MTTFNTFRTCAVSLLLAVASLGAVQAQDKVFDDRLGAGDTVRIQVFQSPELTLETRIQESGAISYPLIGSAKIAGLTIPAAEKTIADALTSGGFMKLPQISITQVSARRKQVSVLGNVGKPGQVALEYADTRLSDVLALAGGITSVGSDTVIITGQRNGKPMRQEINVAATYLEGKSGSDILMAGGDVVYVHRAPVFYVYGEAQRPGSFRLERNMSFMQALVMAGGPTVRGTEKRLRLNRQAPDGTVKELSPDMKDMVQPDDVIFVRESLF
ncbi:polysaccharide export protein EpsE [Rhodoferax lacus]|uniref:Polysaccharide export protein EpsE n=1 Tax=Rhodoferax lacus TaxID=2184758 RepID=A0A3E1RHA5_9BURK|nr:polysaccharide export protein EpsE [Rhodoferax lacus]RFO97990.1 polysaccharide export protein EpsE [Rhodoferax lacus]